MPAEREPTRDGAEFRGLALRAEVLISVGGYLAAFLIAHLLVRHWIGRSAWLHLLPAGRREIYIGQAAGMDLLTMVAVLSVPSLLIGTVLSHRRQLDPLEGLGLGSRLSDAVFGIAAGLAGSGGYVLLLAIVAALSGDAPGLLLLGFETSFIRQWLQWRELGWLATAIFPAAVFSYATARLLLPFGHLLPLLRRRLHPALAAAAVVALYAAPYLLTPAISPLAMLNIVLMGLVLERLRVRTGSLWTGLLGFAAWVLCAELCGLPYQGMLQPLPPGYESIPELLSGGAFGPEGGLAATFLLACCLAALVGRGHRQGSDAD